MRILMLYYPRSGSTSIIRYYEKIRPDYKIINGPWSPLVSQIEERIKISYDEIISYENVLVKSTIPLFLSKNISPEIIKKDFDKIFILIRKNKEEQIDSYVMATKTNSFLEYNPKSYWTDGYNDDDTNKIRLEIEASDEIANFIQSKLDVPLFYYEDLYYDNFDSLFEYLEIEKDEKYFDEFLSRDKRYKANTLDTKNNKTLI
jgi:hypothetical protein